MVGWLLFIIDWLVVNVGDKIGVVGWNGVGKLILVYLLMGIDCDYMG